MASDKTQNKIIRSVKDLPDWYDFEKYANLKKLSAIEWYELLLLRWNSDYWLTHYGTKKFRETAYYYEPLLASRASPLFLLEDSLQIGMIGGGQLHALKNDKDFFSRDSYGVSPLTFDRLYQIESNLSEIYKKKLRLWFDRMSSGCISKMSEATDSDSEWARLFIHTPICEINEKTKESSFFGHKGGVERKFDFVEIDFSVPDKILVAQFKEYLKFHRRKYPIISNSVEAKYPEYRKWIEYGALPYIDLTLWAKEEGCIIPNRVMADAIFLESDKGEEVVRKTTQKIAKAITRREFIDFLATIAAQEIQEENKKKNFRQK